MRSYVMLSELAKDRHLAEIVAVPSLCDTGL